MADQRRDDWQEVSDSFTQLGRMLQDRFTGSTASAQGAEGEVRDAMHSLGEAMNRWGEQVSAAATDPELRNQARHAAQTFSSAVGNAFSSMAEELSSMMRGQRAARPEEETWLKATDDLNGRGNGDEPHGPQGPSGSPGGGSST